MHQVWLFESGYQNTRTCVCSGLRARLCKGRGGNAILPELCIQQMAKSSRSVTVWPHTEEIAAMAATRLTPSESGLHNNFLVSLNSLRRDLVRTVYYLLQIKEHRIHRKLGFQTIAAYGEAMAGLTPRQTSAFLTLARRLPRFPEVEKALGEGRLSWSQAKLITARADPDRQKEWVAAAGKMTVNQLAGTLPRVASEVASEIASEVASDASAAGRPAALPAAPPAPVAPSALGLRSSARGKRSSRLPSLSAIAQGRGAFRVIPEDDIQHVLLRFNGIQYGRFSRLLEQRQAAGGGTREDIILGALDSRGTGQGESASLPYLLVMLQCPDCGEGRIPTPRGEVGAPVALLKAARCDAVVEDPSGKRRAEILPRTRRLIMQRARYRCEAPGCGNTAFLEIHHRVPAAGGGAAGRGNLVVLCSRCHRRLHECENSARAAIARAP